MLKALAVYKIFTLKIQNSANLHEKGANLFHSRTSQSTIEQKDTNSLSLLKVEANQKHEMRI